MDLSFITGPGHGYGQAARLVHPRDKDALAALTDRSGDADPTPEQPTVPRPRRPVTRVEDITEGLPVNDAMRTGIERIVSPGMPPFHAGTAVMRYLTPLDVPAALTAEVAARARDFASRHWDGALRAMREAKGNGRALLTKSASGGPFIGPKGGKWADPEHTIPWKLGSPSPAHAERLQAVLDVEGIPGKVEAKPNGQVVVVLDNTTLAGQEHAVGAIIGAASSGLGAPTAHKGSDRTYLNFAPPKSPPPALPPIKLAKKANGAVTAVGPAGTNVTMLRVAAAAKGLTGAPVVHEGTKHTYLNFPPPGAPQSAGDEAPHPTGAAIAGAFDPAATLAEIAKATGLTPEQIKHAVAAPIPKDGAVQQARAKIEHAILVGGLARENAILDLMGSMHDQAEHDAFVKGLCAGGDKARAVKEYAHTPTYDVQVLSGVKAVPQKIQGQATCSYGRFVTMGHGPKGDYVTGDFRHELGHAVHFAMLNGAGNLKSTPLGKLVAAEYDDAKKRLKADPPAGKPATGAECEERWGLIGLRGADNAHEHAAEHYRGYHREVLRERFKKNGGGQLATYRQRHPRWAALWDARYTAALLGAHVTKGTV